MIPCCKHFINKDDIDKDKEKVVNELKRIDG